MVIMVCSYKFQLITVYRRLFYKCALVRNVHGNLIKFIMGTNHMILIIVNNNK